MSAQPPLPPQMPQQPPQRPQPDYGRAAQDAMAAVKAASQDALRTFMSLIYNPVGALPAAFASLRGNQALGVGIVFMVVYALLAAIGVQLLTSAIMGAIMGMSPPFSFKAFFQILLGGLIFAGGVGLGVFVLRSALKAAGSFATDFLLAGAAVVPLGIGFLAGGVLGKIIALLGLAVFITGFSLSVLVLFTGFTRIGGVKEGPASYLVALALVIGGVVAWIVGKILPF